MKQENITKLCQVRHILTQHPEWTGSVDLVQTINSVLLDENGPGAVLGVCNEPIYECQACFTTFTAKDQNLWERSTHRCPSCWNTDYKEVNLQDKINATLEG
jgi:hypothetical protein